MNKEEYIKIIEESDKGTPSAKKFLLSQINNYYYAKNLLSFLNYLLLHQV